MSHRHTCKALILHCIDFRLGQPIKAFLEKNDLLGDCDIVSLAGAVKNIVAPPNEHVRELVLNQLRIAVDRHKIKKVILMNHTNCAAYSKFNSAADEERQHVHDLHEAKRRVEPICSVVYLTLARIDESDQVTIGPVD